MGLWSFVCHAQKAPRGPSDNTMMGLMKAMGGGGRGLGGLASGSGPMSGATQNYSYMGNTVRISGAGPLQSQVEINGRTMTPGGAPFQAPGVPGVPPLGPPGMPPTPGIPSMPGAFPPAGMPFQLPGMPFQLPGMPAVGASQAPAAPPAPIVVYADSGGAQGSSPMSKNAIIYIIVVVVALMLVIGIIVATVLVLRHRAKKEIFYIDITSVVPAVPPTGGEASMDDIMKFVDKQGWSIATLEQFDSANKNHYAQWCYLGYYSKNSAGKFSKYGAPRQHNFETCGDGTSQDVVQTPDATYPFGPYPKVAGIIVYGKKPSKDEASSAKMGIEFFTYGPLKDNGPKIARWSMYERLPADAK